MTGPIALNTIRTSFVLALRPGVQAVTLLLVARALGPHQFGAFAGIAALALLLGHLSTFGSQWLLLGEVAKKPDKRDEILRWALPTTLSCAGLLLAVDLLVCFLFLKGSGSTWLSLGVSEILLLPLFRLAVFEHHGLNRVVYSQWLNTLPIILRMCAAVLVFTTHPPDPLSAYATGYLTASALSFIIGFVCLPKSWPGFSLWHKPEKGTLRESAGYAATSFSKAAPNELDKTLSTKLLPLSAAGLYAAGARILGALMFPINAMNKSALPRLFRENEHVQRRTLRLIIWMLLPTFAYGLIVGLFLWLFAPVFAWLLGAQYSGVASVIRWLCVAFPGMAMRQTAGYVLMALGRPWLRVLFEACGILILLVAAPFLVHAFHRTGMPLALICSEFVMALGGLVLIPYALRTRTE